MSSMMLLSCLVVNALLQNHFPKCIYQDTAQIFLTVSPNLSIQVQLRFSWQSMWTHDCNPGELSTPVRLGGVSSAMGVNTETRKWLIMSQTEHDPHGYNPVNYQLQYDWVWSSQLWVSIWTLASNLSMSQTEHNPHGYNLWIINSSMTTPWTINASRTGRALISYRCQTNTSKLFDQTNCFWQTSLFVCFNKNHNYSQYCNQCGVSISTDVFYYLYVTSLS